MEGYPLLCQFKPLLFGKVQWKIPNCDKIALKYFLSVPLCPKTNIEELETAILSEVDFFHKILLSLRIGLESRLLLNLKFSAHYVGLFVTYFCLLPMVAMWGRIEAVTFAPD